MNASPSRRKAMTMVREETLANGLKIVFRDESNRYFGDYYRVCVLANIVCRLQDFAISGPEDDALLKQARAAFGDQITVIKRMERMGVPTSSVAQVRASLIDDFLMNAAPYLARAEYPRSLMRAELAKSRPHRAYV